MLGKRSIFISYAKEQRVTADRIALSLRTSGYKVFLDTDDLLPGISYDERIQQAIAESAAFVFLISPNSLTDGRYTLSELKFAREKWNNPSHAILPVIVEPVPHETIPEYLKAVTILEPKGNVAAEVTAAVSKMVSFPRRLVLFSTTGLIVVAALMWVLFPHRQQSTVDLAISLDRTEASEANDSATNAPGAVAKDQRLFRVTYKESTEGKHPSISYQLPYLDRVRQGGPVVGVEDSEKVISWRYPRLAIKIVNNTPKTLFVSRVLINVISSEVVDEPIPIISAKSMNALRIDNAGWGDLIDPVLDVAISEIADEQSLPLFAPAKSQVVRQTFSTTDSVRLNDLVPARLRDSEEVAVSGTLHYGPAGSRKALGFKTTVMLDIKVGQVMPPTFVYPATYFAAGKPGAIITIPVEQVLGPGEADHFLITVGTDKTCRNRLAVSLEATTGEIFRGGELFLDLFVPRGRTESPQLKPEKP
jgi:hypothetical protein